MKLKVPMFPEKGQSITVGTKKYLIEDITGDGKQNNVIHCKEAKKSD